MTTPTNMQMLPGLMYGFPIEGVIRNGAVDGTEPVALDEFILTTKIKDESGEWIRHALDQKLREQHGVDVDGTKKLRRIPIVVPFDSTLLTLHEQYAAFTPEGRALCVGDGNKAKRRILLTNGNYNVETCACPGSRSCGFGQANRCDLLMRLKVRIDGQSDMDGLFILRSGSINGVTESRAFLEHVRAMLGDRLAGVPLWLTLEPKQSAASNHSVFWHVSLRPRFESLVGEALAMKQRREAEAEAGLCRDTAEKRLLALMGNGAFADDAEDDAAQFQELLSARFVNPGSDGNGDHVVTVTSSTDGLQQLTATSSTLAAISQRYSSAASEAVVAAATPADSPVVLEGSGAGAGVEVVASSVEPPPWVDADFDAPENLSIDTASQQGHLDLGQARPVEPAPASPVTSPRAPLPFGKAVGSAQVVRLPFAANRSSVRPGAPGLGAFELLSASRRSSGNA